LLADKLVADSELADTSIVAPEYRQQRGHPVGFGQCYRDELQALNGNAGARDIIQRHKDSLELVSVDDAGVIADIDTPGDLCQDNVDV
jgi:molybdenum cofactor cytidylyltransferase